MKLALLFLSFIITDRVFSDEIYRIHTSHDYSSYSVDELKKRVWDLEKAVWQLQQKVFEIEKRDAKQVSWVCKVKGMDELFIGTHNERALAEKEALEKCTSAGTMKKGFTCSDAICSK